MSAMHSCASSIFTKSLPAWSYSRKLVTAQMGGISLRKGYAT
jgi:hypothetical protein